jgi:predicted nucleic acid-binding protein
MEPLGLEWVPAGSTLLVDSAPIIYLLEDHPRLAARFRPVFEAQDSGHVRLAISTIVVAEVLTGPLRRRDEALTKRYRRLFETWQVVDMDIDIAESAARLRVSLGLKLADAMQAASALAIGAAALVTHDRDFSRLKALPVLS